MHNAEMMKHKTRKNAYSETDDQMFMLFLNSQKTHKSSQELTKTSMNTLQLTITSCIHSKTHKSTLNLLISQKLRFQTTTFDQWMRLNLTNSLSLPPNSLPNLTTTLKSTYLPLSTYLNLSFSPCSLFLSLSQPIFLNPISTSLSLPAISSSPSLNLSSSTDLNLSFSPCSLFLSFSQPMFLRTLSLPLTLVSLPLTLTLPLPLAFLLPLFLRTQRHSHTHTRHSHTHKLLMRTSGASHQSSASHKWQRRGREREEREWENRLGIREDTPPRE